MLTFGIYRLDYRLLCRFINISIFHIFVNEIIDFGGWTFTRLAKISPSAQHFYKKAIKFWVD